MNRRQRQAEAARDRKPRDQAEVIRLAFGYLANAAAPTVTGATLILPDGSSIHVSAEDAKALHAAGKPRGRA